MRRVLVMTLVLVALGVLPAFAQGDRGQIAGFIKDQTGGVIPGATVTATNSQTRLTWTAVTDARGYYVFPALPPGRYELSVELQGFKRWVQTGMTLDASSSATMDVTLETGGLTETVSVTAEATPLQTDVAVRKTVEAKDIELMSFSGRNPIGVVSLKAGVMGGAFNSRGFDDLGNGGFNINGSRARREQHLGRRRHRDPDAVERRHHRHSKRRRHPGSAGPHGQLHARVRARQRRADPIRDQERQQPLQRQRIDLLSRRLAAGQHLDAQSQHQPVREQRPGAVRLPAVRLHRSADRYRETG